MKVEPKETEETLDWVDEDRERARVKMTSDGLTAKERWSNRVFSQAQ